MNEQPEALRLAEILEKMPLGDCDTQAAAELRRLYALNAELLEVLIRLMRSFPTDNDLYEAQWEGHEIEEAMSAYEAARAAIVKAQGESNE